MLGRTIGRFIVSTNCGWASVLSRCRVTAVYCSAWAKGHQAPEPECVHRSGSPRRWLSGVTDSRRKYANARPGSTYCVSARVTSLGMLSPWSAERCTAVPLDDRGLLVRHGRWSRGTPHGYYLGTATVTTVHGAELVRPGVLARRISLIGTKCRTCGTVQIYWNGAPLRRVNFASQRLRRRVRVNVANFPGPQSGTLLIKVVSARRTVHIDGLGVSQ